MYHITVLPNKSLKSAICESFKGRDPGSYQLEIASSAPRVKNSSGVHKMVVSKIRVANGKNGWFISEFTFSLDHLLAPVDQKGDFELLDAFDAFAY